MYSGLVVGSYVSCFEFSLFKKNNIIIIIFEVHNLMKTCHFSVEVLSGFVGKLTEDDLG